MLGDHYEATVGTCHLTADDPRWMRIGVCKALSPPICYRGLGHMPLRSGPCREKPELVHTLACHELLMHAHSWTEKAKERRVKSEVAASPQYRGIPMRDSWKKLQVHGAGQTPHPLMLHSFVGLGRSIRPNPPAENRRTEMIKWCLSPCSGAHTHTQLRDNRHTQYDAIALRVATYRNTSTQTYRRTLNR